MKNEIVERWEKTGLLEGLDGTNKSECATSLQKCAELLIGEKNEYMKQIDEAVEGEGSEGFYAGYILPIMRRIYDDKSEAPKARSKPLEWLMEDFGEYAKRMYHVYKDLEKYHEVDGAAEFVHGYMMHLNSVL
jgi:hypothetical protein